MGKRPDEGWMKRVWRGYTRFHLRAAGYDVDKFEDPRTRKEEARRVARKQFSLKGQLLFWLVVLVTLLVIVVLIPLAQMFGWG